MTKKNCSWKETVTQKLTISKKITVPKRKTSYWELMQFLSLNFSIIFLYIYYQETKKIDNIRFPLLKYLKYLQKIVTFIQQYICSTREIVFS